MRVCVCLMRFPRGKRACKPRESRWSPPPMNTRNFKGVTNAVTIGYIMEVELGWGGESEMMDGDCATRTLTHSLDETPQRKLLAKYKIQTHAYILRDCGIHRWNCSIFVLQPRWARPLFWDLGYTYAFIRYPGDVKSFYLTLTAKEKRVKIRADHSELP
ncbi:hypothetical protein EVAR_54904_1 [Eumeta japonica]|uniref:Uncharacterized protein n=1 Tax=Eumeta variegata TaxID=151549 RepID=A0A4C1Z2N3_EUMVA|nr:hypothetical protein EVAR_54904_1 [Eumeta japonica]